MAHVLIMPRQGNTVESCILVEWKVGEGDTVTAETEVCNVETDKAAFEVPAGANGIVLKLLRAPGDDVPVLEPIAVIGAAGEDWQTAVGAVPDKEGEAPLPQAVADANAALPEIQSVISAGVDNGGTIAVSPRARNLATRESVSVTGLSGSGPGGRIIERDVAAVLRDRPPFTAAASALAAAAAPDLIPSAGSGIGGRITAADLSTAQSGTAASAAIPHIPAIAQGGEGAITETLVKGIRKVIADRMSQSLAETAQFTLNAAAPALRLQELRSRMKHSPEDLGLAKITINDLILFAVSRTLPRFPFMNAHKVDNTVKVFERVHLGVAVDTPRGLMVPVIRNANLLSLAQISCEAKRLAAACQNGSAKPDELSGSTFTVSNLGSMGISSFTPVLNFPEVAILGVCGIELKPVALAAAEVTECNNGVRFEPHIGLSLTINHQVVDGAPAGRFLKALGETIGDIDLWLAL